MPVVCSSGSRAVIKARARYVEIRLISVLRKVEGVELDGVTIGIERNLGIKLVERDRYLMSMIDKRQRSR